MGKKEEVMEDTFTVEISVKVIHDQTGQCTDDYNRKLKQMSLNSVVRLDDSLNQAEAGIIAAQKEKLGIK